MIITRRIEVFVREADKELRKAYYQRLRDNRNVAVKVANLAVSHMFVLDNTMPYLSDDAKQKIEYLGVRGNKSTKMNAPYVAASHTFKGKADMGMVSCVLQNVQKMYQEDRKKGVGWNRSLRSYKEDMPVPFKAERFTNLRFEEYTNNEGATKKGCFFELMGIPFQARFGRDRSNNQVIVERVLGGEYKICTSSLQFSKDKIFLMLCVDIPKKDYDLDREKTMYACLDVAVPIKCSCDVWAKKDYGSSRKWFDIGSEAEFNHRRRQIQEAVRRCNMNNRYARGGKGRKKKCRSIERWRDREKNYVDTRLHTYSRILVNLALKHKCGTIELLERKTCEEGGEKNGKKSNPLILRNWSYFGLKDKISYKAGMAGIKLVHDKDEYIID